jgi:cytochrome c oxidase subunit 3/cytochrome o ubiquinol oxidase subunit 3
MSAVGAEAMASDAPWNLPYRGRVGMYCLIVAESAIFTIFVAAYIFYIGKSLSGPTPREILKVPIFSTICLLSSSLTIHWATAALRKGKTAGFSLFWFLTLALGAIFIVATGREWHHMIYDQGFTIQSNLFGTTYYSLVGLHASHVIAGLIGLTIVMVLALLGKIKPEHTDRCEVLSLYWHFVDAVWVIVFTTVYIVGR